MTIQGLKVRVNGDDGQHPEKLYAERACAEIFAGSTGAIITMAATPAELDLGNTNGTGEDLAQSFTAVNVTVDLAAGSFTLPVTGVYRLYWCGSLTGEEDEDITLAWSVDGSQIGAKALRVIQLDATGGVSALQQEISDEVKVSLDKDEVITLGVLGSASEVCTFKNFKFGVELVASEAFDND